MTTPLLPSRVRAVIFDISGTVLDHGSRGPVVAFVTLFARHGVALTPEEARGPMGAHKLDHIRSLLAEPGIAARWQAANGALPAADQAEQLYGEFTTVQREVLPGFCDVIPGVPAMVAALRARGIRIANTTGFDSGMLTDLTRLAAEGGYTPDLWVCPNDVGGGRPAPWMIFHAARRLERYPLSTFIKVGDTAADVAEAHAAGTWSVAVVRTGNEMGLAAAELAALPAAEREDRLAAARARLAACGPHYLIDSAADLIPVVDDVSARLARGERPSHLIPLNPPSP
jgi:phosphonoacetaldehyde hydrolase